MTFYHFRLLDQNEQAGIVCEKGVYLADRSTLLYAASLYEVEDFYVEIFYDPVHHNIVKFQSFTSTDMLLPYLDQVEFSF